MIIDLNALNVEDKIIIDYPVTKDANLDKRIIDLQNAFVKGIITKDGEANINLDLQFKGTMFLSDAITLKTVPYDFQIDITENLEEIIENYTDCYENVQNRLDLKGILWQNIVLEVPISYTVLEETAKNLKGNGWELLSGPKKETEIDPRLQKLKDLLKGDD